MAWVSKRKASDGSARYLANYRDPTGAKRSAGTFRSRPDAERAGHAAEIRIGEGAWVDRTAGKVRFTDYVEKSWWPHLAHLELTTGLHPCGWTGVTLPERQSVVRGSRTGWG